MPQEEFRLPGASYDKLGEIIVAYGEQDGPVSTAEVADVIDAHPTQISRNNGFLLAAGIIEGGKAKGPTEKGKELANALHWEAEKDVQRLWRQLLRGNEFIEKILSAVKVRKGMERSNLESHIAYTSGRKKTSKVMTGAATVVEILLKAGFLEEKNGQLMVAGQLGPSEEESEPKESAPEAPPRERRGAEPVTRRIAAETLEGSPVAIQLQIQCSPDDLDDLAPKLKSFLEELAGHEDESDSDAE